MGPHASVAQSVERLTCNKDVAGSIPVGGSERQRGDSDRNREDPPRRSRPSGTDPVPRSERQRGDSGRNREDHRGAAVPQGRLLSCAPSASEETPTGIGRTLHGAAVLQGRLLSPAPSASEETPTGVGRIIAAKPPAVTAPVGAVARSFAWGPTQTCVRGVGLRGGERVHVGPHSSVRLGRRFAWGRACLRGAPHKRAPAGQVGAGRRSAPDRGPGPTRRGWVRRGRRPARGGGRSRGRPPRGRGRRAARSSSSAPAR